MHLKCWGAESLLQFKATDSSACDLFYHKAPFMISMHGGVGRKRQANVGPPLSSTLKLYWMDINSFCFQRMKHNIWNTYNSPTLPTDFIRFYSSTTIRSSLWFFVRWLSHKSDVLQLNVVQTFMSSWRWIEITLTISVDFNVLWKNSFSYIWRTRFADQDTAAVILWRLFHTFIKTALDCD